MERSECRHRHGQLAVDQQRHQHPLQHGAGQAAVVAYMVDAVMCDVVDDRELRDDDERILKMDACCMLKLFLVVLVQSEEESKLGRGDKF